MKLPNLDKNSYISIYLDSSSVYTSLSYVDYSSGRNYILNDFTDISGIKENIYTFEFWDGFFKSLREKFNWEIFREKSVIPPTSEGVGVNVLTFHLNSDSFSSQKIISVIRQISYDINIVNVNNEYLKSLFTGISKKVGYEDILFLNLNLTDFGVYRSIKPSGRNSLNLPLVHESTIYTSNIRWDIHENLINNIYNTKLKAFMASELNEVRLANAWANFVHSPSFDIQGSVIQDILRSYITVQLLTVLNDNGDKYSVVGEKNDKTLIVIAGDLTRCLDLKKLLLGVIDGLELFGEMDVIIDKDMKLMTLGRCMVDGIQSNEFVFSINDIFNNVTKLFTPVVSSKDRKLILTGDVQSSKYEQKEIFAFSPEITNIQLHNDKEIVSGKFVQGTYWGKNYMDFEIFSDPSNVTYSNLVIDGRPRPIVYGPDNRSNKFKINQWIDESN